MRRADPVSKAASSVITFHHISISFWTPSRFQFHSSNSVQRRFTTGPEHLTLLSSICQDNCGVSKRPRQLSRRSLNVWLVGDRQIVVPSEDCRLCPLAVSFGEGERPRDLAASIQQWRPYLGSCSSDEHHQGRQRERLRHSRVLAGRHCRVLGRGDTSILVRRQEAVG